MKKITTKRITYWAMMLALFCVLGMFSIKFGDNIKVSLQLFVVFLIGMLSISILDSFIITSCYLLLGLFLPIYAGFSSGVSPTFGFVIAFIPGSMILTLIKNAFKNNEKVTLKIVGLVVGCLACTIIAYIGGATFMYFYFMGLGKEKTVQTVLSLCITPYIPFDLIKIALAVPVYLVLEKALKTLNFYAN